ncbi:MAG: hypothetical protein AAB353_00700 [Candidatus Hydrogenedentota bacterium]
MQKRSRRRITNRLEILEQRLGIQHGQEFGDESDGPRMSPRAIRAASLAVQRALLNQIGNEGMRQLMEVDCDQVYEIGKRRLKELEARKNGKHGSRFDS